MPIANTPPPPYYAVIFTSIRTNGDLGYQKMSEEIEALVQQQPGYLGMDSARSETGITVSYWKDRDSIQKWASNPQHAMAKAKGKSTWYQNYKVRICKVEAEYSL